MLFKQNGWVADLRYSARRLKRGPGFAVVSILMIALGVGANTAIFSTANAALFKPLPVPRLDRLVTVTRVDRASGSVWNGISDDESRALDDLHLFEDIVVHDSLVSTMSDGTRSQIVNGELVSGNYFSVLGVTARLGRLLTPSDDSEADPTIPVVISEGAWHRWFSGDPEAVGKTVRIGRQPLMIVGVAPRTFKGTWVPTILTADVWVPVRAASGVMTRKAFGDRRVHRVFATLRPSVSIHEANTEVEAMGREIPGAGLWRLAVLPARYGVVPRQFVTVGFAISGVALVLSSVVFLIVCTNLTNLLLARNAGRSAEMAVRLSLGASPRQLFRLAAIEALLVTAPGGVLGVLVAYASMRLLGAAQLPTLDGVSLTFDPSPDFRVMTYAFAIIVLAALAVGLVPARYAARTEPTRTLSAIAGVGGITRRNKRATTLLLRIQVASSMLLLLAAGVCARGVWRAADIDLGFDPARIAVATIDLSFQDLAAPQGALVHARLLNAMRSLSTARQAALASAIPAAGSTSSARVSATESDGASVFTYVNYVSPAFFDAVGIRLRSGRDFGQLETPAGRRSAVVSLALAERLWPGQDALGRHIQTNVGDESLEVVGVAGDVAVDARDRTSGSHLYLPLAQHYLPKVALVIAAQHRPAAILGDIQRELQRFDPLMSVVEVRALDNLLAARQAPRRVSAMLVAALAVLGLLVALIGLYGALAYTLSRRTREFGVHKAVGATDTQLRVMIVREGFQIVIGGVVPSVLIALAGAGGLRTVLPGIDPRDPAVFVLVPSAFMGTALVACWIASHRVTLTEPTIALRDVN